MYKLKCQHNHLQFHQPLMKLSQILIGPLISENPLNNPRLKLIHFLRYTLPHIRGHLKDRRGYENVHQVCEVVCSFFVLAEGFRGERVENVGDERLGEFEWEGDVEEVDFEAWR
jgi:hypothetical protein